MRTLKNIFAAVLTAVIVAMAVGTVKVQATEDPGRPEEVEIYDLVIKAQKAGLLHKEYAELKDFRPDAEATPTYCRRLLKRAAKANDLDPSRIIGKEATFEWLGENAARVDVPRPEWLRNPELWAECLENLQMEVQYLYGPTDKVTRIQVLAWIVDLFYPDIPVGFDLSAEALAAY
jgi:hypothetical protein